MCKLADDRYRRAAYYHDKGPKERISTGLRRVPMTDKTLKATIGGELFVTGFCLLVTVLVIALNIGSLFSSEGFLTQSPLSDVIGFNLSWIFAVSINLGFLVVRNVFRKAIAKILIVLMLIGLLCNWILGYAILYLYFGLMVGDHLVKEPITSLYFSIVTWTTLGYGDVVPSAGARLIAASEALVGSLWLALLVGMSAVLFRQVFEGPSNYNGSR